MPNPDGRHGVGRYVSFAFAANLCFWIYFVLSFAGGSYPFRHDPLGHPAGAGYTFFGHSMGIIESPFTHAFFRAMVWVEFPSFALARLGEDLIFPHECGDEFFVGISEGGWRLVAISVLSFLQWFLLVWIGHRLWHRWASTRGYRASRVLVRRLIA